LKYRYCFLFAFWSNLKRMIIKTSTGRFSNTA